MAFPSNPTNGQQTTVNGVIYTYNSTLTAWTISTDSGSTMAATALTISGDASIGQTLTTANLVVTGNTTLSSGALTASSLTTGGTLNVSGNSIVNGVTGNAASFTTLAASSSLTVGGTANITSTLQGGSLGMEYSAVAPHWNRLCIF